MHLYCVSGLTVGSEIELPGLNAVTIDRGLPDVTIRSGAVPDALTGANRPQTDRRAVEAHALASSNAYSR